MSDCVSITFEQQKRETKGDIITQHRSNDPILCPVKIWSKIIRRLNSYKSSDPNTTVNTYFHKDSTTHKFTGQELLKRIRIAAETIGSDKLGFPPEQLGLHSARSGAAMAMYLAGVPVFTIMLLGRWSSDAFLRYIRKQVKEFSAGVSQMMIRQDNFYTIQNKDQNVSDQPLKFPSQYNNGYKFKAMIRPLTSVFLEN
jgi:hypothetical protein